MKLDAQSIQKIAQGFTYKLETLILDHNKLTADGIKVLKD